MWDEYRLARSLLMPRVEHYIAFAFTKLSLSARAHRVMKGVLCFNNGQHRASNSSGKVKTRNIYVFCSTSFESHRRDTCTVCVCVGHDYVVESFDAEAFFCSRARMREKIS